MVFMQPQDAIVLLFAFLSACQGQTSAMCEAGGLRESVARPESKNSNSLIGLEWHQTMAKYIIKRVAMGIFSIFIVATVTFFVMNLVPGGPFVAEKSISAAAQQALAEKYGKNKLVWKDNVENFILLKSNEEYFTDPICKNGYFRGIETYNFVRDILSRYESYKKKIKA